MTSAAARAEAARLLDLFQGAGAVPVEAAILQPAETLLDLYGEDIRARAYVTQDPGRGEMMLRPDFTVPVVQAHMRGGAEPARYCYAGEVFRRQEDAPARASEYLQVGVEVFDREAPAARDAEVFGLIAEGLGGLDVRPQTGDIGLLAAAVDALATSDARKAALRRHIWRPKKFRALLDRFAGRRVVVRRVIDTRAPLVGRRRAEEIAARLAVLEEERRTAPIAEDEMRRLDGILALRGPAAEALAALEGIARDWPLIGSAVERLAARLDALSALGFAADDLPFQTTFGRTLLEYYDGFVFGFLAGEDRLVATGGRYDALTRRLGAGGDIPAVGGVIRPELVLEAMTC